MGQKFCVLGLGLMGSRVAKRLAEKGHDVTGWNRTAGAHLDDLSRIITLANNPCEAVKGANIVLLYLHDGQSVRDVILNRGVVKCFDAGTLLVDMGTNTPAEARDLAAKLPKNISFADGPVSGGTKGAQNGTLSIFLGIKTANLALAQTLLEDVGRVTHMGEIGTGQAAKLANQIIVACTIAALGEGIAYGEALGISADKLVEAMAGGLADSEILKTMGGRITSGDFSPRGRAATHLKDMDCAFSQIEDVENRLVSAATARKYLQSLVASGKEFDHSAMVIPARKALARELD